MPVYRLHKETLVFLVGTLWMFHILNRLCFAFEDAMLHRLCQHNVPTRTIPSVQTVTIPSSFLHLYSSLWNKTPLLSEQQCSILTIKVQTDKTRHYAHQTLCYLETWSTTPTTSTHVTESTPALLKTTPTISKPTAKNDRAYLSLFQSIAFLWVLLWIFLTIASVAYLLVFRYFVIRLVFPCLGCMLPSEYDFNIKMKMWHLIIMNAWKNIDQL